MQQKGYLSMSLTINYTEIIKALLFLDVINNINEEGTYVGCPAKKI